MPGTFEYIDGAFRPDNRRILGLLAGTQLYETPLAALRELLQNALTPSKNKSLSSSCMPQTRTIAKFKRRALNFTG